MSVIEKALERAELTMEADRLPKKDRTVKTFQRLIAAIRATEAEVQDRLGNAESQLNDSLRVNLELQERCHRLEDMVRRYKVADSLNAIESLTSSDRQLLLDVSNKPVNEKAAA